MPRIKVFMTTRLSNLQWLPHLSTEGGIYLDLSSHSINIETHYMLPVNGSRPEGYDTTATDLGLTELRAMSVIYTPAGPPLVSGGQGLRATAPRSLILSSLSCDL